MKKNKILIIAVAFGILLSNISFAAVKINKDEASQYSKKSDYATEIDTNNTANGNTGSNNDSIAASNNGGSGGSLSTTNVDDDVFSCKVASKNGNTYVNEWSNYKLQLDGKEKAATQFYTFNDPDCKFDFGVYWPDWSRLAIYYTRLSRDIDEVAKIYAKKKSTPRNVVVGGEIYRYVQEAIKYPYGTEYYDYYLRNVDGKLMVIECFHENEADVAPSYIEKIEKNNG